MRWKMTSGSQRDSTWDEIVGGGALGWAKLRASCD